MKLASLQHGRDGRLIVVANDLRSCRPADAVAPTLQAALDDWATSEPRLRALADELEAGGADDAIPFDSAKVASPLPRAFQFVDGSAYLFHVELVRKARGAEMPPALLHDPLMYQAVSDGFLAPTEPILAGDESFGIDFEAEVVVVTDEVPMGVSADTAARHIVLVTLVNDVSLRGLIPAELTKGFGFLQGKPRSALAPVMVTPDSLGGAWDGGKLRLPLITRLNGEPFGHPDAGADMQFDFPALIAHAARTRPLAAGTLVGSGTVSNRAEGVGSSCLAEKRMVETIERGEPATPFLHFGDRVEIEMLDANGRSIFGKIDQRVERYAGPGAS